MRVEDTIGGSDREGEMTLADTFGDVVGQQLIDEIELGRQPP